MHTEVEAKGKSDCLSEDQLSALINKAELVKITDRYRPSGTWAFWYPELEMDKTELETGQEVRLKTRGNNPFICESCFSSLSELRCCKQKNGHVLNSLYFCFWFSGGAVGFHIHHNPAHPSADLHSRRERMKFNRNFCFSSFYVTSVGDSSLNLP